VRTIFQATAITAVGIALLSCSPRHRVVYLPPPPAYWPAPSGVFAPLPPPTAYSPAPSMRYGKSTYARSETSPQSDGLMVLQSSPRRGAAGGHTVASMESPLLPGGLKHTSEDLNGRQRLGSRCHRGHELRFSGFPASPSTCPPVMISLQACGQFLLTAGSLVRVRPGEPTFPRICGQNWLPS
jgi:hypothetical protein